MVPASYDYQAILDRGPSLQSTVLPPMAALGMLPRACLWNRQSSCCPWFSPDYSEPSEG